MLLFGRNKLIRQFEEGLEWKAGEEAEAPRWEGRAAEGVFVEVPAFGGEEQFGQYIAALGVESEWVLCGARPKWIQLRGHVSALPAARVRDIARAVCREPGGLGLDLNPRLLEPGDIAGFRAAGVERFCFSMDSPYDKVVDPVRRARALGAFASVEVRFGDELNWLSFMHAVGRALETSPAQICLSDGRGAPAGSEQMEKAGERIAAAGFRRASLWAWAKGDACFDGFGLLLSGRCAHIGPGAFTCRPQAFRNPGLEGWLGSRLAGRNTAAYAEGAGLGHWLALASGLYALELKSDGPDGSLNRHASALRRMGIVDGRGRPVSGRPMEFCHGVARAAQRLDRGDTITRARAVRPYAGAPATDKEGMGIWKTGSGGS